MKKTMPIGIEDFEELIRDGYYYVDKTLFIKDFLDKRGKVNLFTRPRRFGKTLNMSMLRYFFEDTGDAEMNEAHCRLFEGLKIMDCGQPYLSEMCSYPVIQLSLKSAKQPSWELAFLMLKRQLALEFERHSYIKASLDTHEQERFQAILLERGGLGDYIDAVAFLSKCLEKCHHTPVIILIDEYDVPLENAFFSGFYQQMVDFIRSLFESALKTNPFLHFAVITGCLRITKESIFTGLNNLKINSILSENYGEYFGFSPKEVETLLHDFENDAVFPIVRDWYNGYQFGGKEVYNPWSVLNYADALMENIAAFPSPYWSNTSSNSIVKELIEQSDLTTRDEIEQLIAGGSVEKPVHEDITYEDIHSSQDNLWNFLFFTGYLKQVGRSLEGDTQYVRLAIPNREVAYIYKNAVRNWFDARMTGSDLSPIYRAFETGDTDTLTDNLSRQLQDTISFFDYAESYYHGFLTGILKNMGGYMISSNRESGTGRPDIILKTPSVRGRAIILELKVAKTFYKLDEGCDAALQQIQQKKYADGLRRDGYQEILSYGICFYQKECLVKKL